MSTCAICGNDSFGAGPGGRMSFSGLPPQCEKCQSLERHRTYRKVFTSLVDQATNKLSFLQFSNDRVVEPTWFSSHQVSIYQGDNSLDVQYIDKDSGEYDIVMCNHVLQHVASDTNALCELLRITKDDGFVFLTVPSPLSTPNTNDWGYPKTERDGAYRLYGADFKEKLISTLPAAWIASVTETDDVTNSEDIVFLISHTSTGLKNVTDKLPEAVIINIAT